MKLKSFLFRKNFKTSSIIFIIIFIVITVIGNKYIFDIHKNKMINEKRLFDEVINGVVQEGKTLLKMIRFDPTINLYLDKNLYMNNYKSKKINNKTYYQFTELRLNKYKILSDIKERFPNTLNIKVAIYDIKRNLKLTNYSKKIMDNNINKLNYNLDFGEYYNYVNYDGKMYLRFYGLSEERTHLIVLSYEISSNLFIERLNVKGMKVIISDKNNRILNTSFIEGKRAKRLKNKKTQKIFFTIINKGNYTVYQSKLIDKEKKLVGFIQILKESNFLEALLLTNVILILVLLFFALNILTILNNSNNIFLYLIENIKNELYDKKEESKKKIKAQKIEIDENKEIIEKIIEYKEERLKKEKIIENQVAEKTLELKSLNKKSEGQNLFLKEITGKDSIREILDKGFNEIKKSVDIQEVNFTVLLNVEDHLRILRVNEEEKFSEEFHEVSDIEKKKLMGKQESKSYKIKTENVVVISKFFKTPNIGGGILRIIFNQTDNYKEENENIVDELGDLLILSLKSAKLYEMSLKDPLTGALNRGVMKLYLEKMMMNSKRYDQKFSILMIDIDKFKDVNDKFGHITGDFVLRKVIDIINISIREVDTLFRYGGEEFIVLFPGSDLDKAFLVAERIRKEVEKAEFKLEKFMDQTFNVTISIGVEEFNQKKHKDVLELIHSSDEKMYYAKKSGRNVVIK